MINPLRVLSAGLVLAAMLLFCGCEQERFDINGDWEIIQAVSGSGQDYDPDRAMIWTFSGTAEEGEISTDVSFSSGTYRVRGKLITMEIVSGRGPYWYNRYYNGIITGNRTMQGQYEGSSVPLDSADAITFSGSWWAHRKK
jgi:hypothetical protein